MIWHLKAARVNDVNFKIETFFHLRIFRFKYAIFRYFGLFEQKRAHRRFYKFILRFIVFWNVGNRISDPFISLIDSKSFLIRVFMLNTMLLTVQETEKKNIAKNIRLYIFRRNEKMENFNALQLLQLYLLVDDNDVVHSTKFFEVYYTIIGEWNYSGRVVLEGLPTKSITS